MHDARAIANFFLDRAHRSEASITIMTLLKVLYFSHAWYLAKYREPLIAQPFEAWKHGPVNRVVYDQYKDTGERPLTKKAVSFDPLTLSFKPTEYNFDAETEKFLGDIAIAPAVAKRNAQIYGRTLPVEMKILILHGVLHLLGYDHETDRGEMARTEKKLRRRLGLA